MEPCSMGLRVVCHSPNRAGISLNRLLEGLLIFSEKPQLFLLLHKLSAGAPVRTTTVSETRALKVVLSPDSASLVHLQDPAKAQMGQKTVGEALFGQILVRF